MSDDMVQGLGDLKVHKEDALAYLECGGCGCEEFYVLLPLANNPTNRIELLCVECDTGHMIPDGDVVAKHVAEKNTHDPDCTGCTTCEPLGS